MSSYNITKGFLGVSDINSMPFNQEWDAPTYLTFKIEFDFDDVYNRLTLNTTYDELPQALLQLPSRKDGTYPASIKQSILDGYVSDLSTGLKSGTYTNIKNYSKNNFSTDRHYSAIEYLLSRNEDYRAYLLSLFLQGLYALQTQYQFYFQEISGLDGLKGLSPDKGWHIDKNAVIKVKCLEGMDQKIKYLISLYKAVAWDDKYQRWILPDIYRYFKMNIYISEIRTFHKSNLQDASYDYISEVLNGAVNNITNTVESKISSMTKGLLSSASTLDQEVLELMDTAVPITCYRCSMCDFDITTPFYADSYNINNDKEESNTFSIRVKQCEIFNHWKILSDLFIKNFYSARERQKGAGNSSYNFQGAGFHDVGWFNNTDFMADADKYHAYTQTITADTFEQAWEDGIGKAVNTDDVVSLAAELYTTIAESVSNYNSRKAAYSTISTATTDTGSRKQKIDSMTDTVTAMVAESAHARNLTEAAALEILKNTGKIMKENNNKVVKDIIDGIKLVSSEAKEKAGSIATQDMVSSAAGTGKIKDIRMEPEKSSVSSEKIQDVIQDVSADDYSSGRLHGVLNDISVSGNTEKNRTISDVSMVSRYDSKSEIPPIPLYSSYKTMNMTIGELLKAYKKDALKTPENKVIDKINMHDYKNEKENHVKNKKKIIL